MNNVISLKKISNVTEMVTDEDYHIPAVAPYLEEHLQINKELFFNSKLMPAWFHLSHLGLDYDKHSIMEADEVHAISSSEDLQSYRFKQNPKRPNIKKSVVGKGKDFRQKPIFVVKERLADTWGYKQLHQFSNDLNIEKLDDINRLVKDINT